MGAKTPRGKYPGWTEALGNRKAIQGLGPPILDVLSQQTRAIGPRRVTYNLIDNYASDPVVAEQIRLGDLPRGADQKAVGAKDWLDEKTGDTINVLREIGVIHPDDIADGKSTTIIPWTVEGADEYAEALLKGLDSKYRHDRQQGQPQRIEVWTEAADTIPDLRDLCDQYGVPVVSSGGSFSVDALSKLGKRLMVDYWNRDLTDDRPTIVLYCGDYDPAGLSIPGKLPSAAKWADRWHRFWTLHHYEGKDRDAAWLEACQGADPEGWTVLVEPLAVLRADLAGRPTSPVKPKVAEQYARWWPKGETRTLQLEGISVATVVDRVRTRLEALTDRAILNDVLSAEAQGRQAVRDRLKPAV